MVDQQHTITAVVHQSPLMSVVEFDGQQYYTSQYFHRQYIENSPYGGKYKRFDNFMRLLRSIHTYQEHTDLGNIREIEWTALKQDQPQKIGYFRPLFTATGYRPLTLCNVIAQTVLRVHIDIKDGNVPPGYLYAIRHGNTHYVKIGVATDFLYRLKELQCGNPIPLSFIGVWKTPTAQKIERFFHKHFMNAHIRGEWFYLSEQQEEALIALMRDYKSMRYDR